MSKSKEAKKASSDEKKSDEGGASSLPSELVQPVSDLDAAVSSLSSNVVSALTSKSTRADLFSSLTPLERAKVDLASAFAANSLAWMWLRTKGEDPKQSEVKGELDRVRAALKRVKEAEVRLTEHARVDKDAAKRFVKSGLWMPKKRDSPSDRGGRGGGGRGAKRPRNQ